MLLFLELIYRKMGQAQSEVAAIDQTQSHHSSQPPTSVESLIAGACTKSIWQDGCCCWHDETQQAVAYGNDENESLDAKAQKALECPCIADLRNGSCGFQFSEAFLCFLKSTAEEKGSECVHPFVALQNCIKAHPGAFSKDILEEEVKKEEVVAPQDYKIIPPSWSRESSSSKSKL